MMKKPTLLCILDGVGIAPDAEGNAVTRANTPVLDGLLSTCPHSEIRTDGTYVGLPQGQMGNSEVGHMTIGAGRVIKQSLSRITDDMDTADFFTRTQYVDFKKVAQSGRAIHIIGLMSDGGVHSHGMHALHLCRDLNALGVPVFVHAITDGRDVDMKQARDYIAQFANDIVALENVHLASVIGRFFAMDRDKRWDRVQKSWDLFTSLKGKAYDIIEDIFADQYEREIYDEFIEPSILPLADNLDARIQDGDSVFLFNFRADRMRQITDCFLGRDVGFTCAVPRLTALVSMTMYDEVYLNEDMIIIYPPETYENILGQVIADAGQTQLRAAETEKYPHVTYYLNVGVEKPFAGEDRLLVNSPRDVKSYDEKPEMSLPELTEKITAEIERGVYDFIGLNIANGDMVGHCGDMDAAINAMERVDSALGRILEAIEAAGGQALVIADHGNIEQMINNDGTPCTTHTTNPVPCIYVGGKDITLKNGALADVAPTILTLMGIDIPTEMTGKALL